MKTGLLSFLILLLLSGCQPEIRQHPIQFYYWKTNVNFGETEQIYFNRLGSEKLYIRLFDVIKKDGKVTPTAIVKKFDSKKLKAEYIPVIYFVNEVMTGISDEQVKKLAGDVFGLIQHLAEDNNFSDFNEIQIDCDWTAGTKDAYFLFLKELKNISRKQISSTLRLHQVKYSKKTGVPPADKVYLMCYATSSPIEEIDKNSILDLNLLKDYLKNIKNYRLKMDIALPIYSWAIVTNHLGKKMLINGVTNEDLEKPEFKKLKNGYFETTEDVFLKGIYLNAGFEIKPETISPGLLHEARKFLDSQIKTDYDIVYYHLDAQFLERYEIDDLN